MKNKILDLHVQPPTVSDHAFIKFVLPSIHIQPVHSIRMLRGWKAFDSQAFSSALRDSLLSIPTETLDLLILDQLFDLYSTATTSLLDSMLPRHPVKSRIGLKSVWFDGECRQVHRRVRCAERHFRRTKDPDDRLSWIALLRSLHQLYHRKEAAYWENLVSRNSKNPKRLWSSISGMLGKPSQPLETSSFTASDFLNMLTSKTDRLLATTMDALPRQFSTTTFVNFRSVLESDLHSVLSAVNLKSCELDPMPPFIIVELLDDVAPFLLYVSNRSLKEGYIPPLQKRAIVSPSLKKPNLYPTNCQNFRPISYLSFISKTLECLVSLQLLPYLENSGLLLTYQSGFRANHSTETALLSLHSDIYSAIDKSQLSLLALFDVSAAFDMVDHQILLERLETSCGISSLPLL